MEDYFFYLQIQRFNYYYLILIISQGENSKKEFNMQSTIPIGEIPHMMRAMGFFPTDQEIDMMINEVKFSKA
jgi:Ca2+-binding EF-hand superfamily protein